MLADAKRTIVLGMLALSVTQAGLARAVPLRKIVVTGQLEVLQEDDFQRGRTRRIYRLHEEGSDRTFVLKFQRKLESDLVTGTKVQVRGDAAAAVDADAAITVDPDTSSVAVLQTAVAVPLMRRVVVLLVDFTGDSSGTGAAPVACTDAQVADLMYTRASTSGGNFGDNYVATSYDQLAWDPNADGIGSADVFRVAISASIAQSCDTSYSTWADQADAAASAAGINLGLYQHRLYILPGNTNCAWAGLANVGCADSCRAWVTACGTMDVLVHEIGHNLGMGHSSTDTNNDGIIDSTCSYWGTSYGGGEYCDRSDFMGIGGDGQRQNDAPHKVQMGWVPADKLVDAGSGTYTLAPLGTDPSATGYAQVLRITRAVGDPYYISYRTNSDAYEQDLLPDYQQKTSVHTHGGGSRNTLLVTELGDAQSFIDAVTGISVTQNAHTATSATVTVSLSCTPGAPVVSLTPSSNQGRPGGAVSYTVLLTNSDAAACAGSTFALSATTPTGWSAKLSSTGITLTAGQQGSTTLTVTSPSGAIDGTYPVSVTATDPNGLATAGASYCVDGTGPSAVTTLTASTRKTRVQLTWNVSSVSGCATIAAYDVYRNAIRIATTTNTGYVDTITSGQSYAYTVVARDVLGNQSAAGNVVTIGSSSGGSRHK